MHVFVADVDAPVLADEDRHHLERVLRIRHGEELTVADGFGSWRECRFTNAGLQPTGPIVVDDEPVPPITIAFALTKGERPEVAVQKLTEVGVDRIVPFVAARSIVRWDGDKRARQLERLRKVAREASMQSRRSRLPVVDDVTDFATVAALEGATLADAGSAPPAGPSLRRPTVLVGPEGGWSDEERTAGLPTLVLGPQVLRAETAAIVAGSLLVALRSAVVGPPAAHG